MIFMDFFAPELPVRVDVPERELAIDGKGRRGREMGNDGAFIMFRGGRGMLGDARGERARAAVGLRDDGRADIVIVADKE